LTFFALLLLVLLPTQVILFFLSPSFLPLLPFFLCLFLVSFLLTGLSSSTLPGTVIFSRLFPRTVIVSEHSPKMLSPVLRELEIRHLESVTPFNLTVSDPSLPLTYATSSENFFDFIPPPSSVDSASSETTSSSPSCEETKAPLSSASSSETTSSSSPIGVYFGASHILKKISGLEHPDDDLIIAEFPVPPPSPYFSTSPRASSYRSPSPSFSSPPSFKMGTDAQTSCSPLRWNRILVIDGVSDPGNVGTLVRTAAALGWNGVICTEGTCDPFNEKAMRAAMGSTFAIPLLSPLQCSLSSPVSTSSSSASPSSSHGKYPSFLPSSIPPRVVWGFFFPSLFLVLPSYLFSFRPRI
jgi:hypothetical protein